VFVNGGVVSDPGSGSDARGLAVGQLDPAVDLAADLVFGNFTTVPGGSAELFALLVDLTDVDGDGIIDDLDNAPLHFNPPLLDMNADGGLNRFDQLDADGVGEAADATTTTGSRTGSTSAPSPPTRSSSTRRGRARRRLRSAQRPRRRRRDRRAPRAGPAGQGPSGRGGSQGDADADGTGDPATSTGSTSSPAWHRTS
jgi:hypothetical protein